MEPKTFEPHHIRLHLPHFSSRLCSAETGAHLAQYCACHLPHLEVKKIVSGPNFLCKNMLKFEHF